MSKLLKYGLSTVGVCSFFAIIIAAMLSRGTFGHLVPLSDEDRKTIAQVIAQDPEMTGTSEGILQTLWLGPFSLQKTSSVSAFVFRGKPIQACRTVTYGSLRFGDQVGGRTLSLRMPGGSNSVCWYECGKTTISLGSTLRPNFEIGHSF